MFLIVAERTRVDYKPAEDINDENSNDDLEEILHMSPPAAQPPPGAGKKKDLEVAMEPVVSLDFHKGNVLIRFLLT